MMNKNEAIEGEDGPMPPPLTRRGVAAGVGLW